MDLSYRDYVKDIDKARRMIVAITKGSRGVHGSIPCPVCEEGALNYTVAKVNGHIRAACTTPDCVSWME